MNKELYIEISNFLFQRDLEKSEVLKTLGVCNANILYPNWEKCKYIYINGQEIEVEQFKKAREYYGQ